MDFFEDAKSVRLKGHHGKYLWADEDRQSVSQRRDISDKAVVWRVEHVPERNTIRLKSRYDLYLMGSELAFLLGATGKKVLQSFASKADSSLEWEPIGTGTHVKLKTKRDTFLRANGGLPPWRNSVTHDVPFMSNSQELIVWEVDIVENRVREPQPRDKPAPSQPVVRPQPPPQVQIPLDDADEDNTGPPQPNSTRPTRLQRPESKSQRDRLLHRGPSQSEERPSSIRAGAVDDDEDDDSPLPSPRPPPPPNRSPKSTVVRRIFYSVADDNGEALAIEDEEWGSFLFPGHSLKVLTEQLQIETGIDDDIILCARHPLSAKLYRMRLELPPNKAPMHVVIVRAHSPFGRSFTKAPTSRASHLQDDDNLL